MTISESSKEEKLEEQIIHLPVTNPFADKNGQTSSWEATEPKQTALPTT